MKNLTKHEINFIIDTLQERFTYVTLKLSGTQLGDIERKNYEYVKNKSR